MKNWRGLFDCVGGGGAAVAEELARRSWVEKATCPYNSNREHGG